ncbi:MAG: hypothetical protein H7Z16_18210 [Pyrinomonadaceae bacterium]|nr:hypothetical protein [Pyrinomonadaceae bacterium]
MTSTPPYKMLAMLGALGLLLLSSPAFAQADSPLARKVDAFGDIQASDLIARLDNLAIQLQNEPTARGFLIVYRERRDLPGLSNRYAHRMRDYLVNTRGISSERVITVDGGIAACLTQELWVVSPGGAPKPRSDAYFDSYQPSAYKFDEHHYSSPREPDGMIYWREPPAEMLAYLEAFAQELRKNPKSHGYLIAYKSATRDRASVTQTMLRKEREFLVREFGIKASRIKTIDGGSREWRTMELWIAQQRGDVPIITSYRYSPRRRRR